MLKQSFILLSLVLLSFTSQAKDYTDYHKTIIKAERQIFVSNQIDSGINTYIQVFKEFDFVFLHDCVTAMYVALQFNREKAFKVFIDKATKNGLLERHLNEKTKFKTHPLYVKNKNWIDSLYKKNRAYYLKRLDTTVINRLYSLYEYDQSKKNGLKKFNSTEPRKQHNQRYTPIIREIVMQLKEVIAQKGWLSDKLVGIDQEDLFKELKIKGLDLTDYLHKYEQDNVCVMGVYDIREKVFSSTLMIPILIHFHGRHDSGNLYDTTFYKRQIALGNIHPKDFAFINDMWHFPGSNEYFIQSLHFGVQGGGNPWDVKLLTPIDIVNGNRERYFMPPLEQDKAKWKFLTNNHWSYNYGYQGCRS